jgi:hypothetical protein
MKNTLKGIRYLAEVLIVLELTYIALTLVFLNTAVFHKVVSVDPKEL